jgi:predicted secreted protein
MAKLNGTVFSVLSGADKLLHSTSCTLNVEVDLPATTNKDDGGWATHINGARNWSIDFDGMYDTAGAGLTANEIISAIVARTADTVISFTPDGGTSGWDGNGTYQNITISADLESPVTFSGSIKGNGPLAAI